MVSKKSILLTGIITVGLLILLMVEFVRLKKRSQKNPFPSCGQGFVLGKTHKSEIISKFGTPSSTYTKGEEEDVVFRNPRGGGCVFQFKHNILQFSYGLPQLVY